MIEDILFILIFAWMIIHVKLHHPPQNTYVAYNRPMHGRQIYDYLRARGYCFSTIHTAVGGTTRFVYVSNQFSSVVFMKQYSTLTGSSYTWSNKRVNPEWAEMWFLHRNETIAQQQQYEDFQKWLRFEGLQPWQIISVLDWFEAANSGLLNGSVY